MDSNASAVEVRVLSIDELEWLELVEPEVFDYAVRRDWARECLADPRHVTAVARAGARVVGMCTAFAYSHPDKPRQLFVNELGVAPAWRGRGIAGRLVEAVLARGAELGCAEAWVATELDNAPARRVYAKLQAREEADRAVVFLWELAPGGVEGATSAAAPAPRSDRD